MLVTEAFAADRVEDSRRVVAKTEWRSSTIKGSTDRSTARMYDNLADCFKCGKKGRFNTPG